jgi:hypothetical protein
MERSAPQHAFQAPAIHLSHQPTVKSVTVQLSLETANLANQNAKKDSQSAVSQAAFLVSSLQQHA